MTYLEKLRRKTGQTKTKIAAKLAKLKSRSETSRRPKTIWCST
jgi:hypothetical protein